MPLKYYEQEALPLPRVNTGCQKAPSSLSFLFHCGLALATSMQPCSLPGSGIPATKASSECLHEQASGCGIHHQFSKEQTLRNMHKNQYHSYKQSEHRMKTENLLATVTEVSNSWELGHTATNQTPC